MASSVLNSTITGLAPVWSSQDDRETLYRFRSIERSGYLTVTELVRDFITDAATEAAFDVVNVCIVETHLSSATAKAADISKFTQYTTSTSTDPYFLAQRIRKIVDGGAGYAVDDVLFHYVNGARSNVKIKVTAIDTANGTNAITAFEVLDSGDYSATPTGNAPSASKELFFRVRPNPNAPMTVHNDFSYDEDNTGVPFYFQSSHTGTGTGGPTPVPKFNGIVQTLAGATPNWWEQSFWNTAEGIVVKGRGPVADRNTITAYTGPFPLTASVATPQTRWPVNGIWANIEVANNDRIVPGAEVLLAPGEAGITSTIDPGTVIVDVGEIDVVNGITGVAVVGATNYYETTKRYVYFTVNKAVTINKDDRFYIKGNGAAFSDNTTVGNTADEFTVIVEALKRIDPLAELKPPVTGKVEDIVNTSSYGLQTGNIISVSFMSHGTDDALYAPIPCEGAVLEHNVLVGALDLNGATIANVANIQVKKGATIGTWVVNANIVTDANISSTVAATLKATKEEIKMTLGISPYRLAFTANGKQTLNIAAGTKVQLGDDANVKIARVSDYTGSVVDIAGLMGNVPSKAILSSLAAEKATAVTGTAGGTPITTVPIYGQTTGPNVMVVTAAPTGTIRAGYCLDNDSTVAAWLTSTWRTYTSDNVIVERQILPLNPATPESLGGIGRYYLNKSFATAAASAFAGAAFHKVIDRDVDINDLSQGFVNRSVRVASFPQAYPLSYFVTFAHHGIFFGVWEGSWSVMQKSRARQISEKDAWFAWFVIQRPVHRKTGYVRTGGQSPVFCINSVGYKYWKFIVRERDVLHPSQGDKETSFDQYDDTTNTISRVNTPYRVPADAHTEDSHAVLNSTHQIALTEDSKYLVSFIYNLTTPRFRYSDELDLIGQTAADVSMASSNVILTAYGEPTRRVYKSLGANLPYNAGLRISVLKDIYTS